ncbi:MAG: PD40 domain-containing protein, partial [Deltaproteobacteria bacterium]|nr:PD40 domain-containing protein [Deltaproteobacteria bacterium]
MIVIFGLLVPGPWSLVPGPALASSFHPPFGWRTIDTEHFSVHYHNELEAAAQKAAGYLEQAHQELSPKYEWKPRGRTQVIVTDQNDDANGMASTLPYNWMLLRVVPPDPESSLAAYDDWLKMLIFHEYTHILHLDAYGGFWRPFRWVFGKLISPAGLTPGWIKEGSAALEETEGTEGGRGRASYSEMLIRTAVLQGQFPPIDRAAGVHWQWPAAQTQYIFGVKFLQYLEGKYGYEKIQHFHRRTQRSFFIGAINKQAKKVFGKSYYKLWKEWEADLRQGYEAWEREKAREGFTKQDLFSGGKDNLDLPVFSRDGKKLAYVRLNPRRAPRILVRDLDSGKERVVAEKAPSQISFAPDGNALVFSTMARHARHYFYYDLYRVDLAGKKPKVKRLTRGLRARDPDWHPREPKIIFIASDRGTDRIKVYDIETKKINTLVGRVDPHTQFAHPRYSPDGSQVAAVRFLPGEGWQIVVAEAGGKIVKKIKSNGTSVFSRPAWTPDGTAVIYSSDEDGVSNLYRFDPASEKITRLTNTRTGLFQPVVSPADGKLLSKRYHGEGYEIVEIGPGTENTVHGPLRQAQGAARS